MQGKVALFIPNLKTAGAERVTVLLANGLVNRGYNVDVVLVDKRGDFLADLGADVRLVDLQARRALRAISRLARYLRRERPKVLISALDYANVAAMVANGLSFTGIPVVPAIHTSRLKAAQQRPGITGAFLHVCLNWFYRRAKTLVCVSHGVAEDMIRIGGVARERIRVIYNPVIHPSIHEMACENVDHPWLVPRQFKTLLAVGRLTPQKDIPTLLRAFSIVRESIDARLILLGDGDERPKLEGLIKELGLESCVSMLGIAKNPYAYMARADLFVLPSAWEALPTVLIEALACGAKVVATDCVSGPREILQGGRYGTLVPVGDAAALSRGILSALSSPRPELPAEALRPYTMDYAIDEYCRIIKEVTHG